MAADLTSTFFGLGFATLLLAMGVHGVVAGLDFLVHEDGETAGWLTGRSKFSRRMVFGMLEIPGRFSRTFCGTLSCLVALFLASGAVGFLAGSLS